MTKTQRTDYQKAVLELMTEWWASRRVRRPWRVELVRGVLCVRWWVGVYPLTAAGRTVPVDSPFNDFLDWFDGYGLTVRTETVQLWRHYWGKSRPDTKIPVTTVRIPEGLEF